MKIPDMNLKTFRRMVKAEGESESVSSGRSAKKRLDAAPRKASKGAAVTTAAPHRAKVS